MELRKRTRNIPENNGVEHTEGRHTNRSEKDMGQKGNYLPESKMRRWFGFEWKDLSGFEAVVKLLNRPMDPSSLGALRILFGLLMLFDVFHERGMHMVDYDYGDRQQCRFPLFDVLKPLPIQWMYIVFLVLIIGALGIILGLLFRFSCFVFTIAYWYLFLLDKTMWNNHSYLYGLCALLLLLSDANRWRSLDGLIWPRKRNAHVPLWNYTLFRAQFFLVYFVAGLKKLDKDWVFGHSMNRLSAHSIFTPFTYFLSHDAIDLWVVHRGGLCLDLFIGFVLFFDVTRPFGFVFGGMFHVMNSRIFSIGMFPYTMLATMPVFCHADWPRRLAGRINAFLGRPDTAGQPQTNPHCYYAEPRASNPAAPSQSQKDKARHGKENRDAAATFYHKMASVFVIVYLATQCFLPYSHFLTKGYNNWTEGLYGYSWDMMVHSWSTQHVTISYVNKDTGELGYLNPEAWTRSNTRWVAHGDMVKQYALCVQERLRTYGIANVQLYFDVWRSLNDRFQQRLYDPRIDVITAEWHPFRNTPWVMPLLTNLSEWRVKLDEIEKDIYTTNNDTDVVFIADFPGLELENYVQEDLGNTSVQVLKGRVKVTLPESGKTTILNANDKMQLPAGAYHHIKTVSPTPSCYMYIFKNTTEEMLTQRLQDAERQIQAGTVTEADLDDRLKEARNQINKTKGELNERASRGFFDDTKRLAFRKYQDVHKSFTMLWIAIQSVITGEEFEIVFNSTLNYETT